MPLPRGHLVGDGATRDSRGPARPPFPLGVPALQRINIEIPSPRIDVETEIRHAVGGVRAGKLVGVARVVVGLRRDDISLVFPRLPLVHAGREADLPREPAPGGVEPVIPLLLDVDRGVEFAFGLVIPESSEQPTQPDLGRVGAVLHLGHGIDVRAFESADPSLVRDEVDAEHPQLTVDLHEGMAAIRIGLPGKVERLRARAVGYLRLVAEGQGDVPGCIFETSLPSPSRPGKNIGRR